jgi:hypothetical protein
MSARPVGTGFLIVAGLVVAASVAGAIAVIGSPAHQREQRFDERRVRELRRLAEAVERHGRSATRLPASLAELAAVPGSANLVFEDPVTRQPYGYRALGGRRYELCARFTTSRRAGDGSEYDIDANWSHPAGPHCFARELGRDPATEIAMAAADAAAKAAAGTD